MAWEHWFLFTVTPALTILFWCWLKKPVLVVFLTGLAVTAGVHLIGAVLSGVNAYYLMSIPFVFIYSFVISSFVCAFLCWLKSRRRGAGR